MNKSNVCSQYAPLFRALVLYLLLNVASTSLHAQPRADLSFERFSIEHGLSSFPITALLQDRQGFIWVGTIDGLNRYDGYTFTDFRATPNDPNTLSDNIINLNALYEHQEALWIGTRNGLNRLDVPTGRFEHFFHATNDSTSLSANYVTAIQSTSPDHLWIGTINGLNRLDLRTGTFTRFLYTAVHDSSASTSTITALSRDVHGTLWVGTSNGLYRYDPAQDRITPWVDESGDLVSTQYINALYASPRGPLWIGTANEGLFQLTPEPYRLVHHTYDPAVAGSLPSQTIYTIREDDEGALWVGTWGKGLCKRPRDSTRFTCFQNELGNAQSLSSDEVTSLMIDHTGVLWVGTWNGLNKRVSRKAFDVYRFQADQPDGSLSHPIVNAVYDDPGGMLWVGTLGGGLNRLNRTTDAITPYRHEARNPASLSHDEIWAITPDATSTLWIGTGGGGLNRFNPHTQTFEPIPPSLSHNLNDFDSGRIYSVTTDASGALWIGTVTQGLHHYDETTGQVTIYRHDPQDNQSLSYDSVWPLYEDHTGTLWVGTFGGGLNRFDRKNETFRHYRHDPDNPHSISNDEVLTITEHDDGALWVGTMNGLNRLDHATDRFERYTEHEGLPHRNVVCLLPGDEDELWIGTTNGLARLHLRTHTITTYSQRDGLPSATFRSGACHKNEQGELFFGTSDGLLSFFPEQIHDNLHPPPIVLTELELFNDPVLLDSAVTHIQQITFSHDRNFLGFHFAGLDYTAPEENRYAYMLEGLNKEWIYTNRRYAEYPNLPPGRYTFRVKGANSDGVWNDVGASLRVVITPPFWQTPWFAFLVIGLIAGVVLAAHKYRVYHLMQTERMRLRIAEDLHDEVGSEISSLAFSLELAARSGEVNTPQRKELVSLSQRARQLSNVLKDITWMVDTRKDHLNDLIDRMHEVAYQLIPDKRVHFQAPETLAEIQLSMNMRRDVYLIYKEALHNAAKHAQASKIDVCVTWAAPTLSVRITDDGVGFEPANVRRGDGLDNQQERAERMNAQLVIESQAGWGTTVHLTVKIA